MRQLKNFLEKWGIHSFLLPVFFILHNYNQYYGLVSADVAIKILFKILVIFLFCFLLLLFITKNVNKSLQLITLLGSVILFYGVIKDFFQFTLHVHFISKYSVLLPLTLLITILLIRIILKKKDYRRTNLFQNILFLCLILIDGGEMLVFDNSFFLQKNLLGTNERLNPDNLPNPASRPNVYFLVFDCYPGTGFLRNYMQYDNSSLDSSLEQKGFHIISNSKSNYNRTVFSMSSTFNMSYLHDFKSSSTINARDYNKALLTMEHSLVPKIFKHNNYWFYNLSIFNIDGTKSIQRETFLTLPETSVLMYNTLIERFRKDILWNFTVKKNAFGIIPKLFKTQETETVSAMQLKKNYNNSIIDSLKKIPLFKTGSPKFVYAHLYLPHPPFFYDENGKSNDINYIITEKGQKNKQLFLSYLKYTNKIILEFVKSILQAERDKAVVIIQSDHGFTDFDGGPQDKELHFKNYSAFYFPDKDYSGLYDSISNINTFPVLFNKYFNTKIPLQRDTSVFLSY